MEANRLVLISTPIFKDNFSESIITKMVPLIKEIHLNPEENLF
jgi:hypothetical protein